MRAKVRNLDMDAAGITDNYVMTVSGGNAEWLPSTASGGGGGATTLADLTDVSIASPADDEVLTYSSGSWINATVSGGGSSSSLPSWMGYQPDEPPASLGDNVEFDDASDTNGWSITSTADAYDINSTWPHWLYAEFGNGGKVECQKDGLANTDMTLTICATMDFQGTYQGIEFLASNSAENNSINMVLQRDSSGVSCKFANYNGSWHYDVKKTILMSAYAGRAYLHLERSGNNWYTYSSFDGMSWLLSGESPYSFTFTLDHVIARLSQSTRNFQTRAGIHWIRFNWLQLN